MKLNALVVNDDGIDSIGIQKLIESLNKFCNVYVVAPESQRSAFSHSVTSGKITVKEYKTEAIKSYAISGTPADCTRIGLLLFSNIDIVFSGINNGPNLAYDLITSGTVSGAREAILNDIPGVAISVDSNFNILDNSLDKLIEYVLESKLYSKNYVLNINYPYSHNKEIKGLKKAFLGRKKYIVTYEKLDDETYKKNKDVVIDDDIIGSDCNYANEGYITFTTITLDYTDYKNLDELKIKENL